MSEIKGKCIWTLNTNMTDDLDVIKDDQIPDRVELNKKKKHQ